MNLANNYEVQELAIKDLKDKADQINAYDSKFKNSADSSYIRN